MISFRSMLCLGSAFYLASMAYVHYQSSRQQYDDYSYAFPVAMQQQDRRRAVVWRTTALSANDTRIRNRNVPVFTDTQRRGQQSPKQQQLQQQPPQRRVQTIAIFPGPHKTGTTTIQLDFIKWMTNSKKDGTIHPHPSFQNWTWPMPSKTRMRRLGAKERFLHKPIWSFYMFAKSALEGNPIQGVNKKKIVQLFRSEMQRQWEGGKNLFLSSEFLDILAAESTDGVQNELPRNQDLRLHVDLLDQFIDLLPDHPNIDRRIIGIINYRDNRADHVVSAWHEFGKRNTPLSEFILDRNSPRGFYKKAFYVNSMKLAHTFVANKRIHEVFILNTAGVIKQGVPLSMGVACHALKIPCTSQKCEHNSRRQLFVPGIPLEDAFRAHNEKGDSAERDLDDATLQSIEKEIRNYDCQFQTAFDEKTKWLFDDSPFRDCDQGSISKASTTPLPFEHFVNKTIDIICQLDTFMDSKDCKSPPL